MSKHIAILGAGPIGIEAALYARSLGHSVRLYDRGNAAANVADWGHVHLFTPWRMVVTSLGLQTLRQHHLWPEFPLDVCPSGHELRDHYLLPLTQTQPLKGSLRLETKALSIGRHDHHKSDAMGQAQRGRGGFRLLVEDAAGTQRIDHADVVIDCTGVYGHHRWAGRGGIPAPGETKLEDQVFYTLPDALERDRPKFMDKHALLLGCGFSAATFLKDIEQLNRAHPKTRVTWAIRRPGQAMQLIDGDLLAARRNLVEASLKLAHEPPDWLTYLGNVAVESISASHGIFTTHLTRLDHREDAPAMQLQSDAVVALVGYSPDASLYDQLQVSSSPATGGPMQVASALLGESATDAQRAGLNFTAETLKHPEPDFYILGAKSYGTNSTFLIQAGHRQISEVFKLIHPEAGEISLYATEIS